MKITITKEQKLDEAYEKSERVSEAWINSDLKEEIDKIKRSQHREGKPKN